MDPAVVTGIFALSGAALAGISGALGAALQRRWAGHDREITLAHESEVRLFDHKREAYFAFLDEANRVANMWLGLDFEPGHRPKIGLSDLAPFLASLTRVQVFGSPDAVTAANSLVAFILDVANAGANPSDAQYANVEKDVYDAIRIDLGLSPLPRLPEVKPEPYGGSR